MRRYIRLSYNIEASTPLYPGTDQIVIKNVKEIKKGDSCNTFTITFSNHLGTHIDAPKHFWDSGRTISEYSIDELIFKKPLLIDCPMEAEGIIEIEDLKKAINSTDFDLLLIKTGFQKYRQITDHKKADLYCNNNPCLSAGAAQWLRDSHPGLKAIGIDCISIASPAHRDIGRETHRVLLKEDEARSCIMIIEDLHLPDVKEFKEVIVSPLFIKNIDSAPCTVIGTVDE